MTVRWLTAFIDRPAASFDAAIGFWAAVTGSTLSPRRGDHGEFATLLPFEGDAYLRVQRVADGTGGSHLDLHVHDPESLAARAVAAGATEHDRPGSIVVLRSPAGLPWCAVRHRGEATRPAPCAMPGSDLTWQVDQLCIDIPADRFDEECAFWSQLTGWELRPSRYPDFARLLGPTELSLLLVLQRRGDTDGSATAHLDVASDDMGAVVAHHVELGATVTAVSDRLTVMADPSDQPYCVLGRPPRRGPSTAG